MAELDQWIFQEGHVQSVRPDEYVRMRHHRPDASEPIERYEVNPGQPGHNPGGPMPLLTNKWTGEKESPARGYAMPAGASAANPLGEEAYVFAKGENRQILWAPRRAGMVTRWQTVLGPPHNVDVEWIAEAAPSGGLGQSVGAAEFPAERLNTPGLNGHNANYGGAVSMDIVDPLNRLLADEVKVPPSPVLHHKVTDEFVESVVIPYHFLDGENQALAYIPHGMDANHSALLWRHRQYQRLTPNFRGDPFVTLMTTFFYAPEDWDDTAFAHLSAETLEQTPPFFLFGVAMLPSGLFIQHGIGLDKGWFADVMRDSEPTDLDGFMDPSHVFHGDFQTWIFQKNALAYTNRDTGGTLFQQTTAAPSGHLVVAHSRSSDGFAIGYLAKLGRQPILATVDQERVSDGLQDITIQSWDTLFPVTAGLPIPHHAQQLSKSSTAFTRGITRKAGWIGSHILVYTGPLDQMIARTRLHVDILSAPMDAKEWVPSIGREGTEAADVHTVIKPVKVSANQVFSARLR